MSAGAATQATRCRCGYRSSNQPSSWRSRPPGRWWGWRVRRSSHPQGHRSRPDRDMTLRRLSYEPQFPAATDFGNGAMDTPTTVPRPLRLTTRIFGAKQLWVSRDSDRPRESSHHADSSDTSTPHGTLTTHPARGSTNSVSAWRVSPTQQWRPLRSARVSRNGDRCFDGSAPLACSGRDYRHLGTGTMLPCVASESVCVIAVFP